MKSIIRLGTLLIFLTMSINVNATDNPTLDLGEFKKNLYDENAYSECVLKNTKANMSPYAVGQIPVACGIKATPKNAAT